MVVPEPALLLVPVGKSEYAQTFIDALLKVPFISVTVREGVGAVSIKVVVLKRTDVGIGIGETVCTDTTVVIEVLVFRTRGQVFLLGPCGGPRHPDYDANTTGNNKDRCELAGHSDDVCC